MKKQRLSVLLTVLLASTAHASEFTSTQQEQIGQIATQYLIEHPEVLITASETLQQKQIKSELKKMREGVMNNASALLNDADTPYIGPLNASVNVIQFFDYQCAYCAQISLVVDSLQQENPEVKFIYKETPIFAKRWQASEYAATVGNWVFQQKGSQGYAQYHQGVFALGKVGGQLATQDIHRVAQSAGVDMLRFKPSSAPQANVQLFEEIGFRGTPAFIVMPSGNMTQDNIQIVNGYDPAALAAAIEQVKLSTSAQKSN